MKGIDLAALAQFILGASMFVQTIIHEIKYDWLIVGSVFYYLNLIMRVGGLVLVFISL